MYGAYADVILLLVGTQNLTMTIFQVCMNHMQDVDLLLAGIQNLEGVFLA
jgi:hypothetical protein